VAGEDYLDFVNADRPKAWIDALERDYNSAA
jgi:hypothetical protein